MQGSFQTALAAQLSELQEAGLLRRLSECSPLEDCEVLREGRPLVNFASNDYLGFAGDPSLSVAAIEAIAHGGVGAGASRLVSGTRPSHSELELALSEWKGTEAALSFSSGYTTALGVVSALVGAGDVVILDKLCHASLIDGARLSGALIRVFPHNHLERLEAHLRWARSKHPGARVLVLTEAVFSMDGDRCPLAQIVDLKDRYGAVLLVDEAHSVGIMGRGGRGLADALGVSERVDIQMGTLSKALGCSGGYVCGSRALVDVLINKARSFVYSTAPSAAVAAAGREALRMVQGSVGEERRERLWDRVRECGNALAPGAEVSSAIVPVIAGPAERAIEWSERLRESGFWVPAIRYPTVPRGLARLRITLSADHTPAQVSALCAAVRQIRGG